MNANETISLLDLAAGLRDCSIQCMARDTDLTVEALADPSGPDCYPDTVLEFRRDGEIVASVGAWMLGQYMHGPNRRDNGQYIGDGWSWQCDEDDGATTGRPRSYRPHHSPGTVVWQDSAGSLDSLSLSTLDDAGDELDGADEAIETIQAAIDAAYGTISVDPASDEDVHEALTASRSRHSVSATVGDADIEIDLHYGNDAGRAVYAYDGDDESRVFESASECVTAARKHIAAMLRDAAKVDHDDADEKLAASMEAAATDE